MAGVAEEGGVGGQEVEEGDEGVGVSGVDLPAAAEALDDAGGCGGAGSDEEDWAGGGHEGVDLGGDDCVCQLDLAPFDTLIWPHLAFVPPALAGAFS